MKKLILSLAILLLVPMACKINESLPAHNCGITDCDLNGKVFFQSSFEPDTDGYLFDSLHFSFPDWSGSHLEEHIFEPDHICY
jgi:hypothetical protein